MTIEASNEQTRELRIRLGMFGGGAGAFIGAVTAPLRVLTTCMN